MIMDDFMDITLVCDDRTEFRAHRNILSAFSPVIRQMLQLNAKSSHPVVFLRGVKKQEMESILKFIYLGEVSFNQNRMDEFLAVADILEVQELKEAFEAPQTLKNVEKKMNFDNFAQDSSNDDPMVQDSMRKSPNEQGKQSGVDAAKRPVSDPLMYKGVKLYPAGRKCTSLSWEHGGFIKMADGKLDRSHIICCYCGAQLRYNGSPSVLSQHVERIHNDEWIKSLSKSSQSFKTVVDNEDPLGASQTLENLETKIDFEDFAQETRSDEGHKEELISSREPSQTFAEFSANKDNHQTLLSNKSSAKNPVMYNGAQLFPPDNGNSPSWEHGGFAMMKDGNLNKSHVICRYCGVNLKYNGSPSVLANHVKGLHNDKWTTSSSKDSYSFKKDFSSTTGTKFKTWSQL